MKIKMGKEDEKIFLIIFGFAAFLVTGLFIKSYWIPAKYAVKEQDFYKYEPYIIVQEAHYTGTGWVQVGDESGYFALDDHVDIKLVNDNLLPLMDMYNDDFANKFLCKVEYIGKVQHVAFEDEVDLFRIVEWYPVYPVLRDTVLPAWMFPKNFMTKEEAESNVR